MSMQATGDFPTITSGGHTHTAYGLGNLNTPTHAFIGTAADAATMLWEMDNTKVVSPYQQSKYVRMVKGLQEDNLEATKTKAKQEKVDMSSRRIVQIFIADPDENVPLEKSVIYTGEQKLTDLTDQELYFEINMKELLDKHNAYRVTLINKKVKERTENLEPARVRDLKMVVVNIASF